MAQRIAAIIQGKKLEDWLENMGILVTRSFPWAKHREKVLKVKQKTPEIRRFQVFSGAAIRI